MSSYAIDSQRQAMTATGIVAPAFEWIETAEGKRRPGEIQARDENTGMPLWQMEVLYRAESFGRESTIKATVLVGAVEKPSPAMFTPVTFDGLTVTVRLNKAGGFTEYWSAEGIKDLQRDPARKASDAKAAA
jgi:hypothetical protein